MYAHFLQQQNIKTFITVYFHFKTYDHTKKNSQVQNHKLVSRVCINTYNFCETNKMGVLIFLFLEISQFS